MIVVPASIANLGAGLDTLAVAVRLYLRVRMVEVRDDGGSRLVAVRSTPAMNGRNAVEGAYAHLARVLGRPAPSVFVEVESDIPIGSGLGSSAAAVVAGMRVLERVTGEIPVAALLAAGAALEGHADNVAAALLGGLVSVQTGVATEPVARQWHWPDDLRLIVATPQTPLKTSASRGVLPASVSRADAVFNLQRVVSFLHALSMRDFNALRESVADTWHQPARAALVPRLNEALALRSPDLLGVFLAGAGPSVVALAASDIAGVERLLASVYASGPPVTMRVLAAHQPRHRSNDSRLPASLSLMT